MSSVDTDDQPIKAVEKSQLDKIVTKDPPYRMENDIEIAGSPVFLKVCLGYDGGELIDLLNMFVDRIIGIVQ